MVSTQELLLAYYGDDFTGSTDALEFLTRAGIKTILFIEPPTTEQLSCYEGLQAIGVAGLTRSLPPDEMEAELRPAFESLKRLGVPHVHYKVCSTFDSSPAIGSIGRAMDVGADVFQAPFIPLLVAAPVLGRYCLFGNLFARMGIGSQGQIYRLDRHPSMSRHPVTPAHESDLRLHLSLQTIKKTGLLDILQIELPLQQIQQALQNTIDAGAEVVLFDGLNVDQLTKIGCLIDAYADRDRPLFSVGSSGIEMALGGYWQQQGRIQPTTAWNYISKADTLLVISGSCSPITSRQIETAVQHGFAEIGIDTTTIASGEDINESYIQSALTYLQQGQSVIIHTSMGNNDERVAQTQELFVAQGLSEQQISSYSSQLYGTALGQIANGILQQSSVKRLIIAGGDTSSFAARALGIEAVEMIAPLSPGAPLCKAYAPGHPADGLEVNFKGGQVGDENYFLTALNGQL